MRTTVNLRDDALELAREKARELDRPLGDVISEAIVSTYQRRPKSERRSRFDLPVSGAEGLQAGVELDCASALEDRLEGRG